MENLEPTREIFGEDYPLDLPEVDEINKIYGIG